MPPYLTSFTGSNFWITDNFQQLSKFYDEGMDAEKTSGSGQNAPVNGADPAKEAAKAKAVEEVKALGFEIVDDVANGSVISGKANFTSLLQGAGNPKLKPYFQQAKLLGNSFKQAGKVQQQFRETADAAAQKLGFNDFDRLAKVVARMNRHYVQGAPNKNAPLTDAEIDTAKKALGRMILTRDFMSCVHLGKASEEVRKSLLNATLGLMKLERDGTLSQQMINDRLNGEIIDVSKPGDMLRAAQKTAQKAREKFIDKAGIDKMLLAAEENFRAAGLTETEIKAKMKPLREKADDLVRQRTEMSKCLEVSFDEMKPVDVKKAKRPAAIANLGKLTQKEVAKAMKSVAKAEKKADKADAKAEKAAAKAQTKAIRRQLKSVANAMRSFRFDADTLFGRSMGKMEKLRRSANNTTYCKHVTGRMTKEQFTALGAIESDFGQAIDDTRAELARRGNPIDSLKLVRSDKTSADAGNLTHATNTHIRYFFSGTEQKHDKFAQDVHKMFDPLVAKGGSHEVVFEAGADVRAGINLTTKKVDDGNGSSGSGVLLDAKAGAKFVQKAKIEVAPGGGEVKVTYYTGGAAEASAKARVGYDSRLGNFGDDKDKALVGADVGAEAEIGGGKGREVTYKSLNDFINDVNGGNRLTKTTALKSIFSNGKIVQAFRAIGRGVTNFLAWVGLRQHHSKADNVAYRNELVNAGVIDDSDMMLCNPGKTHGLKTSEKTYSVVQGGFGAHADMDVNLYTGKNAMGLDTSSSVFDLGVSGSYHGERQIGVQGSEIRTNLDGLMLQSGDYLLEEASHVKGDMSLGILDRDSVKSLEDLRGKLGTLNEKLAGVEKRASILKPDDKNGWNAVCADLKQLSVQYAALSALLLDGDIALDAEDGVSTGAFFDLMQDVFERRLAGTAIGMPTDVFEEQMLEKFSKTDGGSSTHVGTFKLTYNVGGSFVEDAAKNSPEGLKSTATDSLGAGIGKAVAKTAISTPISTIKSNLALKGGIEGTVSTTKPHKNDARPWLRDSKTFVGVKLDTSMPVKLIVEAVARKYVEENEPKLSGEKKQSRIKEFMGDIVKSLIPGLAIGELVTVYAQVTLGEVMKSMAKGDVNPVQKFFAGPLLSSAMNCVPLSGLEAGMSMSNTETINFQFEHGKLACMSTGKESKTSSTIGVRFKAGFVGVGAHMTSTVDDSHVTHSSYFNPSFDTMMGKTAEYLRGGTQDGLIGFLTHNKHATLGIFDQLREKDADKLSENGKLMERREAEITAALDKLKAKCAGDTRKLDRIDALRAKLSDAKSNVDRLDLSDPKTTDAAKISATSAYLQAMTRSFELIREFS